MGNQMHARVTGAALMVRLHRLWPDHFWALHLSFIPNMSNTNNEDFNFLRDFLVKIVTLYIKIRYKMS